MDTYQPIFDAVRSKISVFDGVRLREDIARRLDFSQQAEFVREDFSSVSWQMKRPCVLFRPSLYVDGDQWCAIYGEDLQSGVAGFGDSPALAMADFDTEWNKKLNQPSTRAA